MIECIGYKRIGKGTLEGFVNIHVEKWGLEIYGLTHFKDSGREWFNLPKKEYTDPEGKKKYTSILKFKVPEHETKFLAMVKEAVERFTNTMPTSASALPDQMEMPF
jgi:hypothetical protein